VTFVGFHATFLVQHWLGAQGMPRRYADYLPSDGFTTLNTISTIGSFVLGASMLPFVWNVFKSYRYGEPVEVDDPWGFGNSLEWATSCPLLCSPSSTVSPSSGTTSRVAGKVRATTSGRRPPPPSWAACAHLGKPPA
jgi:heme/copper-type cytochrome/quinol oxidase subunit 1